jgi:RNA polymerase sigma-70 factor (ECF subfamily)
MTIARADPHRDTVAARTELVVPVQPLTHAEALAIERLYAEHYRDVFRYVLALTRSTDEAEEITADTFERAIRTWHQVPARPVAWLLLAARRIATDRWRRARRLTRILLGRPARPATSAFAAEAEFGPWFDALARVLTPRQREVLVLRYQRDLSDADIGAVMGITESGVRSLVTRALAVLRAHPELL